MSNQDTQIVDEFLNDVADHKMQVLKDEGVYRHLVFKNNGSSVHWFEIITWPGSLVINGDMGSFTFSRTHDMFTWFGDGKTNLRYWEEKLVASECSGRYPSGSRNEFSSAEFNRVVADYVEDWIASYVDERDALVLDALRQKVQRDLIGNYDDYESARDVLDGFEFVFGESDSFRFHDVWEMDFSEYTVQYQWCCEAIPWVIRQYRSQVVKNESKGTVESV